MSEEFVLETKGHCVLCLKLPPPVQGPSSAPVDATRVFSFHKLTNYLRLNMSQVFHVMMMTPESLRVLEQADLKGTLCPDCSTLSEEFYQLSLELETIQLKIQSCLENIHGKIEAADGNQEAVDEFRKKMSTISSFFHTPIVERLRKETLERCAYQIGRGGPEVILEECEEQLSCVIKSEEEGSASQSSFPVISTVHGNFIIGDQQPSTSRAIHASTVQQGPPASFHPTNGLMNETTNGPSVSRRPPSPQVNVGSRKNRYECGICSESFSRSRDLGIHRIQVHEGKAFQCRYCPSTFKGKQSRDNHEVKTCKGARQAFGSSLNQRNPNPPVPQQAPPAPLGNRATSSVVVKQEFLGNVNIIPKKRLKRFKCAICSIRFQTDTELEQHANSQHDGKRFKCNGCPAMFKTQAGRYLHSRGNNCGNFAVAESSNADSTILNGNGARPDQRAPEN